MAASSRPIARGYTRSTVGAGLPAMAALQPSILSQLYPIYCRSWLAGDGGLTADLLSID